MIIAMNLNDFLHAKHVIKQSKHRFSSTMPTAQASPDGNYIAPLDSQE